MIKNLILIFFGGGLGSVFRFLISKIDILEKSFPYGTLFVNILGSLILGLIMGSYLKNTNFNPNYIVFFGTGFCGGFTTFSTFSDQSLRMLNEGNLITFFSYIALSLFLGIFAVYLGYYIIK